MALLDKPVSMNELGATVVQDIGLVSQTKLSQEKGELTAVWESMYSKGLRRKVSSQCYYTPEEIEKAAREEQGKSSEERATAIQEQQEPLEQQEPSERQEPSEQQVDPRKEQQEDEDFKDLASVHFERALNTGMAHKHDAGRHFRRRRTLSGEFSNSVPMPRSPRVPRHRSDGSRSPDPGSVSRGAGSRKSFAL